VDNTTIMDATWGAIAYKGEGGGAWCTGDRWWGWEVINPMDIGYITNFTLKQDLT
jgi:hypothetical protein